MSVQWMMKGPSINTCNCAWGCPCQFNALPTQGHCRATVGMRIDEGHFADVRLDGLKWISVLAWPGPIHHGKGEVQTIIDEGADDDQSGGLLTEFDMASRARFAVPGMVEARVEPIRNPATGAEHRAKVILPDGFEYHAAEYASSTTKASEPVPQDWADRHAHLFMLHMTRSGVVHA